MDSPSAGFLVVVETVVDQPTVLFAPTREVGLLCVFLACVLLGFSCRHARARSARAARIVLVADELPLRAGELRADAHERRALQVAERL